MDSFDTEPNARRGSGPNKSLAHPAIRHVRHATKQFGSRRDEQHPSLLVTSRKSDGRRARTRGRRRASVDYLQYCRALTSRCFGPIERRQSKFSLHTAVNMRLARPPASNCFGRRLAASIDIIEKASVDFAKPGGFQYLVDDVVRLPVHSNCHFESAKRPEFRSRGAFREKAAPKSRPTFGDESLSGTHVRLLSRWERDNVDSARSRQTESKKKRLRQPRSVSQWFRCSSRVVRSW